MCNMFSNLDLVIALAKKEAKVPVHMRTVIWAALKSLLAEHDSGMESGQIRCHMLALSLIEL